MLHDRSSQQAASRRRFATEPAIRIVLVDGTEREHLLLDLARALARQTARELFAAAPSRVNSNLSEDTRGDG